MKCKSTLNLRSRSSRLFKAVLLLGVCAMTALTTANAAPNDADAAALMLQSSQNVTIKGKVVDEAGKPVIGAAVVLKSNNAIGASATVSGDYTLRVPSLNDAIVVTALGKAPMTITLKPGQTAYNVTLKESTQAIEKVKVVSTGIFVRDKVSFTGSEQTFSGEELKQVSNGNVLQSLKSLDPSFFVAENLEMGSDPNTMMNIEIRGASATALNTMADEFSADPNAPLFVLDGIEVSIETITDLDMNRVESLTILKDAGSTAIYGSKGSNGVIVIETIKPEEGDYRIYYTGDFSVDAPDLSVYNMMNSAEKLEFERLSRRYDRIGKTGGDATSQPEYKQLLDRLYSDRLKEVARGVDTYWLSEPVRTGFTHGHSVRITGGSKELQMTVGAKYRKQNGVMKGSDRETWGGNVNIQYRKNGLTISNALDLSGTQAVNSPYGAFSTWVNTSPYYRKRNDDGQIDKWLANELTYHVKMGLTDYYAVTMVGNPLWNATIDSESGSRSHNIRNAFLAQYKLNNLQLRAGLNLTKSFTESTAFTSPDDTKYFNVESAKKGSYSYQEQSSFEYNAYLSATYAKTINESHIFTGQLRADVEESKADINGYTAIGFKSGSKPAPNYGKYPEESSPKFALSNRRSMAMTALLNYSFKHRYFADFTFRYDGASTFGSNEVFQPFWSVGAGWNINREEFAKDWTWTRSWKLRASYGVNGNQNIGMVMSQNTYKYYSSPSYYGSALYMEQYANPDLPWQKTYNFTVGTDMELLDGRLRLSFDYYTKKSDPLIQGLATAPSTGIGTWYEELGYLNIKGVDGIFTFSPIYRPKDGIILSIRATLAHYKSEYGGLDEARLSGYDENTLSKIANGESPSSIWAVKSAGIDPATGKEIYIKKDGTYSYSYPKNSEVVVGSERPTVNGTIGPNFRYKNFTANMFFRYSIGGDLYNSALFNKVENISFSSIDQNQDKRALYNRWNENNRMARFRGIEITDATGYKTSRFVQKNNFFSAESINVGYELNKNPWIQKHLGAEVLKVSFYANELFRWETSKTERGTSYPFARSFSMSVNLTF